MFLALCRDDPASADRISEAVELLAEHGPGLGRPLVDWVRDRAYPHEGVAAGILRIERDPVAVRVRPTGEAVFLVGGDKAGAWNSWYRVAVPIADGRYALHLKTLEERT